jgi:hypothetical protein
MERTTVAISRMKAIAVVTAITSGFLVTTASSRAQPLERKPAKVRSEHFDPVDHDLTTAKSVKPESTDIWNQNPEEDGRARFGFDRKANTKTTEHRGHLRLTKAEADSFDSMVRNLNRNGKAIWEFTETIPDQISGYAPIQDAKNPGVVIYATADSIEEINAKMPKVDADVQFEVINMTKRHWEKLQEAFLGPKTEQEFNGFKRTLPSGIAQGPGAGVKN